MVKSRYVQYCVESWDCFCCRFILLIIVLPSYTVLNIVLYALLVYAGINYQLANFVTLIVVKLFCYFTNKLFVFHTRCKNIRELLVEFAKFFAARMMTFLMDYFGLILLVEEIGVNKIVSKVFLAVAVIIVNYCVSKAFVFSSKRGEKK